MESTGRVTIKKIAGPNGMTDYYLEYNPPVELPGGKFMKEECLNLSAYTNPCNEIEKRFNTTVETIAEEIRCFRYIQLVNRDYSFITMSRKADVIAFLEGHEPYSDKQYHAAIKSFKRFCNGKCTFDQVTVSYMMAYRHYLLYSVKIGKKLRYSNNTASSYLKNIKRMFRIAYSDRLIDFDPALEIPGITWDHTIKKERLTDAEIEVIKNVIFRDLELKMAILFAIFTGLRRGDIMNIRWENLEYDDGRYYICIVIQKTGHKVRLPLSKDAEEILGTFKKRGLIFPTLSTSILNQKVPRLIEAAGINKHITFHCFRHTFAMRLLDKGVDIPTIAFLLGHKFLGSSLSYLHCTKDHLEEVIAKLER